MSSGPQRKDDRSLAQKSSGWELWMFWPLWFTSSPACQMPSVVSMFGLRDNLSSRHKALWCGSHRVWFSYEITPSVFGKSCRECYCLFNPSCEVYPADLSGLSLINWKTEKLNGRRETRSDVGLLQNMTSFWVTLFLIIYQRRARSRCSIRFWLFYYIVEQFRYE